MRNENMTREQLIKELAKLQYLDIAGVMFVALNAKGEVTLINQKGGEILGYEQEEIIGKNWFDSFLPVSVKDQVRTIFYGLMAGEVELFEHYENPVLTKGGEERIIAWHNAILRDGESNIVGTLSSGEDITERVRAEEQARVHMRFLKVLDRIDNTIRQAVNVEQMMSDVLQTTLDTFETDRAWLLYPCDPEAESWSVPMEHTRPEYPGALALGEEIPMLPEIADVFREALDKDDVITVNYQSPGTAQETAKRFSVLVEMHMVVYPITGKPWMFGMHQCSHYRDWTDKERDLFREIGYRLGDGLSNLLLVRNLHESEEHYRTLFEHLPIPVFTKNREGEYTSCNTENHRYWAVSPIGRTDAELLAPEAAAALREADLRVMETGDPLTIEEHLVNTPLGERQVLSRKVPLRNDSGNIVGILGASIDITERVRADAERERLLTQVQAQARLMQGIVDTVPEGVLLLDAKGRVLLANPVAKGDLAVLVGAQAGEILRPGSGQAITHLGNYPLAELLTSPPTKGLWHEVKTDGRTFEIIARPMENGPEPEDWVLVINDVTQEREIQHRIQQQERLAVVGQLAAGIAHDFNNIMSVIVLYTQTGLGLPDIPSKLRGRLQIIDQQAKRATDLIQQILDFSRRAVLERRPMDLTLFLKEVVNLLERTVPENIKMRLTYGADKYMANADPTRMQQAVMNLVLNARDAILPKGSGELRIALSRTAKTDEIRCVTCGRVLGEEWVRLTVTDTGSGIPPEVLPHIFEPFFTTKEAGRGTGLGLAQVYGIVKQHEGHIGVTTKAGKGTTFTIYLPALLVHQPEAPAPETKAFVQGQGETILVAEDDATLREALVGILESLNYRVLEAADGREALDILEQGPGQGVSLVLSDLVMPETGGQALFHAMRQRGLELPVVVLSGHPMENELKGLQAQGMAGWTLKPLNVEQLARLLARALREGPVLF